MRYLVLGDRIAALESVANILLKFISVIKFALYITFFALLGCENKHTSKIRMNIHNCSSEGTQQIRIYNPLTNKVVDSLNISENKAYWLTKIEQPGVYEIWAYCVAEKKALNTQIYLPTDSIQINTFVGGNLFPSIYQNPGLGKNQIGSYLMKSIVISTASQQRELAYYLRTRDSIWNRYFLDVELAKAKMNAAMDLQQKKQIDYWADSTRHIQERFTQCEVRAEKLFIKKYPDSEINLYVLNNIGGTAANKKYLKSVFKRLPIKLQESSNGSIINEKFLKE